jgi:hypothetical protein
MIMAMDRTDRHAGHHGIAVSLKTLAFALGALVVGYAAVTISDDGTSPLHAIAATAVGTADATADNPPITRGERLPTAEQASIGRQDRIDASRTEPRECRPEQGIVNDCTFD